MMNCRNTIPWNVICWIHLINTFTCAQADMKNMANSAQLTETFNIFPGIRLIFINDEIRVKFNVMRGILHIRKMSALKKLSGESIFDKTPEAKIKHDSNEDEKENGLMKFGSVIAVVPLLLQILSLPGALASIKMSLLKSLLVGKLALALIVFNALRSAQKTEMVVVHETHHQQHNHYHQQYLDSEDDDHENSWFGRKKRR